MKGSKICTTAFIRDKGEIERCYCGEYNMMGDGMWQNVCFIRRMFLASFFLYTFNEENETCLSHCH